MATVLTATLLGAVYLLFAGTVSRNELITAVVLAVLAAAWAWAIRACARLAFAATVASAAAILSALRQAPRATVRVGAILIRTALAGGSPGRAMATGFVFGPPDAAAENTRRAVAVLAASLAPDRFVVDIERGKTDVQQHRLGRLDHAPDPLWLT